jgi:hypothetical protein
MLVVCVHASGQPEIGTCQQQMGTCRKYTGCPHIQVDAPCVETRGRIFGSSTEQNLGLQEYIYFLHKNSKEGDEVSKLDSFSEMQLQL